MPAATDTEISQGAEDRVTGTVEVITGSPARSFETFAADNFPAQQN
jgi:hypothetical protein